MIEQVTRHTFEYDKPHKVMKIIANLIEIGLPPAGLGGVAVAAEADAPQDGAAAGASSPPRRGPPCSSSCHGSPPSPIHKIFSAIFGMCRDIQTR